MERSIEDHERLLGRNNYNYNLKCSQDTHEVDHDDQHYCGLPDWMTKAQEDVKIYNIKSAIQLVPRKPGQHNLTIGDELDESDEEYVGLFDAHASSNDLRNCITLSKVAIQRSKNSRLCSNALLSRKLRHMMRAKARKTKMAQFSTILPSK